MAGSIPSGLDDVQLLELYNDCLAVQEIQTGNTKRLDPQIINKTRPVHSQVPALLRSPAAIPEFRDPGAYPWVPAMRAICRR